MTNLYFYKGFSIKFIKKYREWCISDTLRFSTLLEAQQWVDRQKVVEDGK
jgi:hypothetical protein